MTNLADSPLTHDTIIIGGGAAGLSAAIYASRYLMKTVVLEGHDPGGETAIAWTIENYPGIPKIDGLDLITNMQTQAKTAGAEIISAAATAVTPIGHCFSVTSDHGKTYHAKTLILAQGSTRRRLGVPGEKELTGHGVSYCATCDAPLFRGKVIAIAGGGDAAVKGALLAAEYAKKIYLLARGDKLRAEPVNEQRLQATGKTAILFSSEVREVLGQTSVSGVKLSRPYRGSATLPLEGLFIEIGATPNTAIARTLGVALDPQGYIQVDKFMRTNVHGVYAAGDITDASGSFRQDVTAAAQGALAATSAYQDLGKHGGAACELHARPLLGPGTIA